MVPINRWRTKLSPISQTGFLFLYLFSLYGLTAVAELPTEAPLSWLGPTQQRYGESASREMFGVFLSRAIAPQLTLEELNQHGLLSPLQKVIFVAHPELSRWTLPQVAAYLPIGELHARGLLNYDQAEILTLHSELRRKTIAEAQALPEFKKLTSQINFELPRISLSGQDELRADPEFVKRVRPALLKVIQESLAKPLDVFLSPTEWTLEYDVTMPDGTFYARGTPMRERHWVKPLDGHHRIKAIQVALDEWGILEDEVKFKLHVMQDFRGQPFCRFARAMLEAEKGYFVLELRRKYFLENPGAPTEERDWKAAELFIITLHDVGFKDASFKDDPLRSAVGTFFFQHGIDSLYLKDYIEFYIAEILRSRGVDCQRGEEFLPQTQIKIAKALFEYPLNHRLGNRNGLELGDNGLNYLIDSYRRAEAEKGGLSNFQAQGKVLCLLQKAIKGYLWSQLTELGYYGTLTELHDQTARQLLSGDLKHAQYVPNVRHVVQGLKVATGNWKRLERMQRAIDKHCAWAALSSDMETWPLQTWDPMGPSGEH